MSTECKCKFIVAYIDGMIEQAKKAAEDHRDKSKIFTQDLINLTRIEGEIQVMQIIRNKILNECH